MVGYRVEGSAIPGIVNQALDNKKFQEWLTNYGLKEQDSTEAIQDFRETWEHVDLSPTEQKIIRAFEPFGHLTTVSRVALIVYGFNDPAERTIVRGYLSRMQQKFPDIQDSPIIRRWKSSPPRILRALGASTQLDPSELAVVFLTSPYGEGEISTSRLTRITFPKSDINYAIPTTRVTISKLRAKLPNDVSLLNDNHTLRWSRN